MFTLAILGDRKTCSACQAFYGLSKKKAATAESVDDTKVVAAINKAFPGVAIVDADRSFHADTYKAYRPKSGLKFPSIRVYPSCGEPVLFRAGGMTPSATVKKIQAVIAKCGG